LKSFVNVTFRYWQAQPRVAKKYDVTRSESYRDNLAHHSKALASWCGQRVSHRALFVCWSIFSIVLAVPIRLIRRHSVIHIVTPWKNEFIFSISPKKEICGFLSSSERALCRSDLKILNEVLKQSEPSKGKDYWFKTLRTSDLDKTLDVVGFKMLAKSAVSKTYIWSNER